VTDYPYAGDTTKVAPNQPYKGTGLGPHTETANPGITYSQEPDVLGRYRAKPDVEIEVEIEDASLDIAATAQITVSATINPGEGYEPIEKDVTENSTYESSDDEVATVSADGLVTAVGEGTATITVTYAGATEEVEVTVVDPT